ncbi:hypothetical protein GCK32_005261 [Trichostrongylus colubriformis]|uniref:Uncharacterized protein n=1 Tax=Trichostrongylus colubriformis TaxID=6319 RepID=A0AAN8G6N3_TRICO
MAQIGNGQMVAQLTTLIGSTFNLTARVDLFSVLSFGAIKCLLYMKNPRTEPGVGTTSSAQRK